MQKFIKKNKYLIFLIFVYFLFRLINLTIIPIFNDEAIYLDWGWREIHRGVPFYSLYDGKQPLLMWLFGIFEGFFKDPLFAGRLISVLAGFFSILGLYNLGKEVFNKKIAYIAPLLYIVIPIFSFFDRQASMESAEAATSVWITYLFIKLLKTHSVKIAIALGIIIGIGFFIKSTIRVSSYFEARIISNLSSYKCLTYRVPVYFVSRGNFLGGLDNYLQLERKFYNPEEKSSVGIYVFKSSCSGQTLDLSSPGAILQPKN